MLREARDRARKLLADLLAQRESLDRFTARPPGGVSPGDPALDTMGRGRAALAGAIEAAGRTLAAADSALQPGDGPPQSPLQ